MTKRCDERERPEMRPFSWATQSITIWLVRTLPGFGPFGSIEVGEPGRSAGTLQIDRFATSVSFRVLSEAAVDLSGPRRQERI